MKHEKNVIKFSFAFKSEVDFSDKYIDTYAVCQVTETRSRDDLNWLSSMNGRCTFSSHVRTTE